MLENKQNEIEELVEMVEIEGTPFQIVGNLDEGYFVSFGKYRISDKKESVEETMNWFNSNSWTVMINTITACIDFNNKNQKEESHD